MAFGTYIAAATDTAPRSPVVLFRAEGGSVWTLVHTSNITPTNNGGFSGIHGLGDGSFIVAVGTQVFKAHATGAVTVGAMAVFDGTSWADITVPAGYVFMHVYCPEDGVAYIAGRDTAVAQTGKIWKWEASDPTVFTEVLSEAYATSLDVAYANIHGSGPNDIWATLCFCDNTAYDPDRIAHFDGATWTTTTIDYRLIHAVSASEAYGNGVDDPGGGGGSLLKWNGSAWSIVDTINPAGGEMALSVGAGADLAFIGGYYNGQRVMRSVAGGALANCTDLGGARCMDIEVAPNDTDVLVVGHTQAGNEQAYCRDSTDGGDTWAAIETLTGYDLAASAVTVMSGPYLTVGSSTTAFNLQAFTIASWLKYNSSGEALSPIAYKKRGVNLFSWMLDACSGTGPNRKPGIRIYCTDGTTLILTHSADLSTGAWHFVVATFDGATVRLFVDGVLVASSTAIAGKTIAYNTTDPVYLGGSPDVSIGAVPATLDEPSFWSSAKPEAWAAYHYNGGTGRQQYLTDDGGLSLVSLGFDFRIKRGQHRLGNNRRM